MGALGRPGATAPGTGVSRPVCAAGRGTGRAKENGRPATPVKTDGRQLDGRRTAGRAGQGRPARIGRHVTYWIFDFPSTVFGASITVPLLPVTFNEPLTVLLRTVVPPALPVTARLPWNMFSSTIELPSI
jgi:hypothetical protein